VNYTQITPSIHLLTHSMDRQKSQLDIILTSGGSWFESKENLGRRHLMEHCVVARTNSLNFNELKDYAFKNNLGLNAYTSPLDMGFDGFSHHSDFNKMLDILLETSLKPNFVEEDLLREREIVLREISERRGDPNYKLYYQVCDQVFTKESIANHQVLGDEELVAKTTLPDFSKLYSQATKQSHLIIKAAGGGIDDNIIIEKLQSYLSDTNSEWITNLSNMEEKIALDYTPKNEMQEFSFKTFQSEIAHKHAEVSIFLNCPINFETRTILPFLSNLYFKYGGILYDKLRDELGLVYGFSSYFHQDTNRIELQLSCELKYVNKIIDETIAVFSNYEKYFKPYKFEEFKQILTKKQDLASDTIGVEVNHTYKTLRDYGVVESYQEFCQKIYGITQADFENLYQYIHSNLNSMQVMVVSKDEKVKSLTRV
jgi:predicted Zn-dependent peptidase